MRVHESGSGLIPMNQQSNMNLIPNVSVPPPNLVVPPIGLNNATDGNPGSINVIGGVSTRRANEPFAKENTIQVSERYMNCVKIIPAKIVHIHVHFIGHDCRSKGVQ